MYVPVEQVGLPSVLIGSWEEGSVAPWEKVPGGGFAQRMPGLDLRRNILTPILRRQAGDLA